MPPIRHRKRTADAVKIVGAARLILSLSEIRQHVLVAPARAAGLGVFLAVVKLLVEQSGGTLTVESGEGQGTTFMAVLPRYDVDDYLL